MGTVAELYMAEKYSTPGTKTVVVLARDSDNGEDNSFTASPACPEITNASAITQMLDKNTEMAIMPETTALMFEARAPETNAPIVQQNSNVEEDLDFDLMVETELDASWCLPNDGPNPGQWRGTCQTASIRRK